VAVTDRELVNGNSSWTFRLATAMVAGLVLLPASARTLAQGGKGDGAGVVISKSATAKDVGLPIYPGAKPHRDETGDPAANLGLWGSSFGFKLVVLKMESADAPERVAAFYQKALGKYGTVLDCTNAASPNQDSGKVRGLTCDTDKPEKGGMLFKAGTKQKQHIVGVQGNGKGSVFQLVYVEAHSDDKDAL
jgi:hypothetical protein